MNGLVKAKDIVQMIIEAENFAHQAFLDVGGGENVKKDILKLIHNSRIEALQSAFDSIDKELEIHQSGFNNQNN